MTRLDRYVLAQIILPALVALVIVTFLGVAQELRERLHLFPSGLLTFWDLTRLVLFLAPLLFPIVAPVAYFFGILYAGSRMADQGEITAIKAAGVSMRRVSRPIIVVGFVVAALAFFIQDQLQPRAIQYAYRVIFQELPGRLTLDALSPGVMHEFENFRIYFAKRDRETRTLYDVDIVAPANPGEPARVFHSTSAQFSSTDDATVLKLREGYTIPEDNTWAPFESMELVIPRSIGDLPMNELALAASDSRGLLQREREVAAEFAKTPTVQLRGKLFGLRYELGDRFSFPFAAIGVAIVGAGTALRVRRGGRSRAFAIGFSVLVSYFLIRTIAVPHDVLPLSEFILRGWLPNLVLVVFGTVQLMRVSRV